MFYNHRTLQSAVDAAAYSAAIAYSYDTSADIETEAKATVGSYGYALGTGADQANVAPPTVINPYANSGVTAIQVTASRPQTRFFSSYWIKNLQPNDVSAIAIISGGGGGNNGQCIMSLSPTGAPNPPHAGAGILLGGTSTINATNCGVFSNSTTSNSILVNGASNQIIAGSVGTAGAVSNNAGAPINPQPTTGDGQLSDPYGGLTVPAPGTCLSSIPNTINQNNPSPGTPVTLQPGTYCSNVDIQNSTVTLASGTYIFDNARFQVDTHSSLSSDTNGVTLVFTSSSGNYPPSNKPMLDISSGATINLQASTSGTYEGMLILGNSTTMPTSTQFNLQANSGTGVRGVIYLPNGNFTWGGAPILSGGCTQMMAYTIDLQGNATFNNTGCNFPRGGPGGIKPIGSVVTLVK